LKKTAQAIVRTSEIADHMPIMWRRRVNVARSVKAKQWLPQDETTVGKEFSKIFEM
jgi:hypothetical protein